MEVAGGKNILYVVTKGTWGGAQRYVFDLMQEARSRGHFPALAYGEGGLLVERLQALGYPTEEIPGLLRDVSFLGEFRAYFGLVSLMKRERPDIVHLNSSKAGALGAFAAKIAGVRRVLFTAHGWAFSERRSLFSKIAFWFAHYITVLLADRTIAVSEAVKRQTRFWPFLGKKVCVVRNGIAVKERYSKEAARTVLIKREPLLARNKNGLWVGTIAELHPNKGLDIGITAWKKRSAQDASWVIIGEGQERASIERLRADDASIALLGFMEDAADLLPAFDIFLLPSRTEALAYVLLEAGAAGVPCVVANVGGMSEIVEDGVSGLLGKREDASSLTRALDTLMQDVDARERFGKALQKRIRETFTRERMCDETFALYQNER